MSLEKLNVGLTNNNCNGWDKSLVWKQGATPQQLKPLPQRGLIIRKDG